jgi:hypothetical protein
MWPALREGDQLLCGPLDESPVAGSVLVAREGSQLVAHRLTRKTGSPGHERFILKADLGGEDRPRRRSEIVGHALLVHRQGNRQGLCDIDPPLTAGADVGPVACALLRRVARWHTTASHAQNAGRISPIPLLDPVSGVA